MEISALSSGSSGNCFYICNHNKSILIDAGISCRQVMNNLAKFGKNPEDIKGIFLSHEHTDHISGVDVLSRKFGIPIFATKSTFENSYLTGDLNPVENDETVDIAGMKVELFSKSHDAADPVSFSVKKNKKIGILTDIGYACKNVVWAVNESDFLVIESNHDLRMLEAGPYPYFLKRRILGDKGHISNLHSGLCVLEHANRKLKNILLAHLSETNNTSELALATFHNLIKERSDLKPKIEVSERDNPSKLFEI